MYVSLSPFHRSTFFDDAPPDASNPQPKTLFQKTRMEASRIQKSIYTGVTVPRTQGIKDYRVVASATHSAKVAPSQCATFPSRVTINTVYRRDSPTTPSSSSSSASRTSSSASSPTPTKHCNGSQIVPKPPAVGQSPRPLLSRPPPPAQAGKKDPMAALFMPKHRAHSQLPDGFSCIVSR